MPKINLKTISWHLIFWVCLFLYEWLPSSSIHDCYQAAFNAAILNVPIIMVATYFNIFISVERFLLKKKYELFAICMGASLVVFGLLRRIVNFYMVYKVLYPPKATLFEIAPDRRDMIGRTAVRSTRHCDLFRCQTKVLDRIGLKQHLGLKRFGGGTQMRRQFGVTGVGD